MAKLTAWLITLIGVLLVLALFITSFSGLWFNIVIAVIVLIIGISKLIRNYSYKK